ncbi:MAG: ATP synthase subunit I [Gammaproteobacteria bacterium]|nr:ATP synthase subunit I [Gammaproteobacteria bacterium]
MNDSGNEWSFVGRILCAELMVAVAVAAIALVQGAQPAYSAFLGGLACLIPDAYFAVRVFGRPGAGPAEHMAGRMLRAEIAKLILSVVVLGFIFAFIRNLNMLALVSGYVLVKTAGVVAMVRGADTRRADASDVNASGNQAHG